MKPNTTRFHLCPLHGEERCLMSENATWHGCRGGGVLAFIGRPYEREFSVVRAVVDYTRKVIME